MQYTCNPFIQPHSVVVQRLCLSQQPAQAFQYALLEQDCRVLCRHFGFIKRTNTSSHHHTHTHMEKETHHPRQLVYVGIAAEPGRIAISFYDGHWSVGNLLLQTNTSTTQTLLASISEFARTRNVLPVAAGIDIARLSVSNYLMFHNDGNSRLSDDSFDRLPQRLWFDYDILPFRVAVCGLMLEECADSAARKCLQWFRTCCVPKLDFAPSNRVMVDCDSIELAALSDYQSTVSAETWKVLLKLTEACKQRRLRISFFNSTPQVRFLLLTFEYTLI